MVTNETIDRLDRLVETAKLEHEVARLNRGAEIGNREDEASGALMALKEAKEALTAETDPTLTKVEAHVVRNIIRMRLFGVLTFLKTRSLEWLHIGDRNELGTNRKNNLVHVEYEFLETLRGTRIEVLQQFLKKYEV